MQATIRPSHGRLRRPSGQACMRLFLIAALAAASGAGPLHAQDATATIKTLIQHETDAGLHRGHYIYTAEERSDRTHFHWWKERVIELPAGKIHFLVAEDGKPLPPDREAAERGRLAQIVANPDEWKKAEAARIDDEQHAKAMLSLLPKAFLFEGPTVEGPDLKILFRPNPAYQPQSMEEKVMHSMSGTVLIDEKLFRLRGIDGRMPTDVSFGFGLATIKAGSYFQTLREHAEGPDWKTETVHTEFVGKALFLKTIARQQESKRADYKKVPDDISVKDAVALVEQ